MSAPAFTACIDIGGTFTDCLVEDANGEAHIFKAITTPGEFQDGFMDSLAIAAAHFGMPLGDFLKATTAEKLAGGEARPIQLKLGGQDVTLTGELVGDTITVSAIEKATK